MGATESNPSSSQDYGTGLAAISGATFGHSVRQLYGLSCCSEQRSQTFSVGEGYRQFSAWIGVATGEGNNDASHTPAMTFEVDVGGATNRVYTRKLSYGDAPQRITVSVRDQADITLGTMTDDSTCYTCEGEAVWGNARLAP